MLQKNWQDLIKPEKLVTEAGVDPGRTATIVAEPLERGFGLTLGNALRRVLLSSLQGAAVTAVQIDGVVHEFSSMEGVREDVVDIILNIKSLALRMHAEGPKRMTLKATGPGPVARRVMRLGPSECIRSASCLMLRTMSTTSSRTPSMEENSCTTPSIWTAVTAAPCSDDSSTRRSALPSVTPKPRSSGSATIRARRSESAPDSIWGFSGRISSFQFLSITDSVPRRGVAGEAKSAGDGE